VDPAQRIEHEVRQDESRADEQRINRRLTFENPQAMRNHHQHHHYSRYPLENPKTWEKTISNEQKGQAQEDAQFTCQDLQAMRDHHRKRRQDFHGRDFTTRHQRVEDPPIATMKETTL
jgi:hypothetical protein